MWMFNAALGFLVDAVVYPFRTAPAVVSLAALALATAIGMLLVFRATSNQRRLEEVKRRIQASLFEIRLFNDDPRAILAAQADILRHNVRYLGLTVVPMLCLLPILVPLLVHLDQRYGYEGFEPGDRTVVTLTLSDSSSGLTGGDARPSIVPVVPDGVSVETPMVWIPSRRQAAWRLRVGASGDHELGFRLGGTTVTKRLRALEGIGPHSPAKPSATFAAQFWNPAEAPLPAGGPVALVSLAHRRAEVAVLGWRMHWLVPYFVLSLAFALMLRRSLGVTI